MKKILIFGSTGSIGTNALDIIRNAQHEFSVLGLCVHKDAQGLLQQIDEFNPRYACIVDEDQSQKIRDRVPKTTALLSGAQGLKEFSQISADIAVLAIPGISCLDPLCEQIKHTSRIALANKESIVVAGSFIFEQAQMHQAQIIPVDSEINSLFQLVQRNKIDITKVYVTASGGALKGYTQQQRQQVTVDDVLNHPTWRMGKRVTVDSATLVNKGFEVIETHFFFGIPYPAISVVIHPESTIHAIVEYSDLTQHACLYSPDMRIPIAYALGYPCHQSQPGQQIKAINYDQPFSLTFQPLQKQDYPLFFLITDAAKRGDNALPILNACDEVVIEAFLQNKIKFTDIRRTLEYMYTHYPSQPIKDINDVFQWDTWARDKTKKYLNTV